MKLDSDLPFEVVIESMPDHTLKLRNWDDPSPDNLHTCLVVRTTKPETKAKFTMEISGTTAKSF